MIKLTRREFVAGAAAAGVFAPAVLRAQETVIRWGEMLATTHPQVQMVDRIAATAKEKSSGRIDIQSGISFEAMSRAIIPWLVPLLAVLVAISIWPPLTTALPRAFLGQ